MATPPRFGAFADRMAKWLLTRMPMVNPVNLKVYRGIGRIPASNPTLGGLHLEDIASRLAVWITYYLPQGTLAILAMQRPFETWGRNMAAWLGTFAVAYIAKDQNMGVNGLLDLMMVPKGSKYPVKIPKTFGERVKFYWKHPKVFLNKTFGRFFDKFRPNYNYLELFQKAGGELSTFGIKGDLAKAVYEKPIWAKFDVSELDMFEVRKEWLADEIGKLGKQLKTVANGERTTLLKTLGTHKKELAALKNLTKRLGKLKYLSLGVFVLLAAYFIGITVQKWVFKFIAPIDQKLGLEKRSQKPEQTKSAPQQTAQYKGSGFAGNNRYAYMANSPAYPHSVYLPHMVPQQQASQAGGGGRRWY